VAENEQDTEVEAANALLCAILEFRITINRLVEEQKALVLGRAQAEREPEMELAVVAPAAPVSVPARPQPAAALASAPGPVAPAFEGDSKKRRQTAAGRPRLADLAPASAVAVVAPVEPAPSRDATAPSRTDNPRQRLDALARLLDKRAKQSTVPAAGPSANPGDG
jgi:hypothetical protein